MSNIYLISPISFFCIDLGKFTDLLSETVFWIHLNRVNHRPKEYNRRACLAFWTLPHPQEYEILLTRVRV
ncbi:hypothetical protein AAMO2058_000704600 [Amorphochlora amoebiformis]